MQKFIALYKEFGVTLNAHPNAEGFLIRMAKDTIDDETSASEKFEGYNGFCSDVYFDHNEKFIRQGFWE